MNISRAEVGAVWTATELRAAKAAGSYRYVEALEATWSD
jgi:hypothetical protein